MPFEANGVESTPPGFRSAFRDWCAECTERPRREIAELSLAHSVGNAVEKLIVAPTFLTSAESDSERWPTTSTTFLAPWWRYEVPHNAEMNGFFLGECRDWYYGQFTGWEEDEDNRCDRRSGAAIRRPAL